MWTPCGSVRVGGGAARCVVVHSRRVGAVVARARRSCLSPCTPARTTPRDSVAPRDSVMYVECACAVDAYAGLPGGARTCAWGADHTSEIGCCDVCAAVAPPCPQCPPSPRPLCVRGACVGCTCTCALGGPANLPSVGCFASANPARALGHGVVSCQRRVVLSCHCHGFVLIQPWCS